MHKNIGYHVSIKSIKDTTDQLINDSVGVAQIFITGNISFAKCTIKDDSLLCLRNKCKKNKIKIIIHAPYVVNLSNIEEANFKRCKSLILNQLDIANRINAVGVVIHMGKRNNSKTKQTLEESVAIDNYKESVSKIIEEYSGKAKLILETSAGQGSEICSKINELSEMYYRFTETERTKLGICIDTCHVFAAGHDISGVENARKFYKKVNKLFNKDDITCVHMNDSKDKVNCKKDRHQDIGQGEIGVDGLKYLFNKFNERDIPMVLETPTGLLSYMEQIELLESKE